MENTFETNICHNNLFHVYFLIRNLKSSFMLYNSLSFSELIHKKIKSYFYKTADSSSLNYFLTNSFNVAIINNLTI